MNINLLKEVARFIESATIERDLTFLESKKEDCPLVLPVMGEFSSGKTTLINALTDSKQLETATKPTTATIYEVHFGSEKCCAEIYYTGKQKVEVDNISDLHNEEIADAAVVEVYDTSNKVPSSIVLVDTPGLSSPDPRHKQTLIDFLPESDGILLVSDINQPGLTKSLTDFIKTMELSKRRIYLILTKCDTKSEKEICEAKRYIEANNGIKQCNIVAVSAKENNIDELFALLSNIQHDKADILEQVNKQRVVNIAQSLINSITTLKKASLSDDELDDAIAGQEHKLSNLNNSIQNLISSLSSDIEEITRKAERTFEDTVSCRLEILTGSRGVDFDAEATSIINNSASMIISSVCAEIQNLVHTHALKSNADFDFSSLNSVDLSSFALDGLEYNLNLNSIGHNYDRAIATGLKIATAAAVVYTAHALSGVGAALNNGGSAEFGESANSDSIVNNYGTADLVVDAAQTAMILKNRSDISQNNVQNEEQGSKMQQIGCKYNEYEQHNQEIGRKMGLNGGIVESVVSLVTDSTMGKPQRRRAVYEYMESTLMPSFKGSIKRNCDILLNNIHENLLNDATTAINEIKESLKGLKEEKQTKEQDFQAKIKKLNEYSITLNQEFLCGNF
ncbi:MAG: dynamin family protein [Paludibacteraceae bacterium]|nr:dynamin family protein [Paludibacteraceae bacterium]